MVLNSVSFYSLDGFAFEISTDLFLMSRFAGSFLDFEFVPGGTDAMEQMRGSFVVRFLQEQFTS